MPILPLQEGGAQSELLQLVLARDIELIIDVPPIGVDGAFLIVQMVGSVYDVTTQICNAAGSDFGLGDGRDGVMLLISMYERDWAMFVHGELYCIVPLAESACVTVKSVEWNYEGNGSVPTFSDPLYCGEVGKPFLMYVNYGGVAGLWDDDPDTIIEYERDDGFAATWFPEHEEGCIFRQYQDGHDSVMDFSLLYDIGDYIPYLDIGPAPDSEWLPPTDLGLGNTAWYSDNGWVLEFSYDESAGVGSGCMVLYQPVEDEDGTTLTPYYDGTWWMEDGSLCLGVYEGNCPFPLLISPSGEKLVIMQADDGSVLPFFEKGQTTVGLTLRQD